MANFARQNQGKPIGTDLANITVVAGRIDNVESALVGNLSLSGIDITGGTIDGTTVGITTPSTGQFTSLHASTLVISGGVFNVGGTFSTTGSVVVGSALTTGGYFVAASGSSIAGSVVIASQLTVNGNDRAHVITDTNINNKGNGTPYAIEWNQEVYDVGGLHSSGTEPSRLTVQNTGTYMIVGQIQYGGGTPTDEYAMIYVDGAEVAQSYLKVTSLTETIQVSYIAVLTATSYVQLVMNTLGTTANVVAAGSFLQMIRIY